MKTLDEAFFENKILIYHDYLKKYLRTAFAEDDLAEDVVQDTMARAWEKIRLLHEYRNMKAAVRVMATHIYLNYMNSKKNSEIPLDNILLESKFNTGKDNLLVILESENRRTVLNAVGKLKEPCCSIILLKYYYGLSFKQISAMLDMNYNTVLSHHRRSMARLKKILST